MKRQPYRKFSKEFKIEAVRLAEESDKPVTQIARELDIGLILNFLVISALAMPLLFFRVVL